MALPLPPLDPAPAAWLRAGGHEVSPLGARAAAVLAVAFGGVHNLPSCSRGRTDWSHGHRVEVLIDRALSTWDGSELTRLVVAAHDAAVRVTVEPRTFRHLVLVFHHRARAGHWAERHPTLDDAAEHVRRGYALPHHAV